MNYRNDRYLWHLSDLELSERYHDVMNKETVLGESNKIAPRFVNDEGFSELNAKTPLAKMTALQEECRIRYREPYPQHQNIRVFVRPNTEEEQELAVLALDALKEAGPNALLRFGAAEHEQRSYETGGMRLSLASSHAAHSIDDNARRDEECSIVMNPAEGKKRVSCPDYNAWCATKVPESAPDVVRLFGDFKANSCIVIRDGRGFLADFMHEVQRQAPGRSVFSGKVRYIDPVLDHVASEGVPTTKHFRFQHQLEVRVVCFGNPTPLDHMYVALGCLEKYGGEFIHR